MHLWSHPLTAWMQTVTSPSPPMAHRAIRLICKFTLPTEGHPYGTLFPHCFSLERGGLYLFREILNTHHEENRIQSLLYCSSHYYFTVMHRFGKSHQNPSFYCVMLIAEHLRISQYKLFPVN